MYTKHIRKNPRRWVNKVARLLRVKQKAASHKNAQSPQGYEDKKDHRR